ncbi:MAG: hypothetical protein D6714_02635 [Bacteroidetes bacterium]|nr:MAG: hypothetical protein D6714_02635 [Bacteroidota bacterium]
MKKLVVFLALGLIWMQGCIPSIHPIYTADTLVSFDQLVGEWSDYSDPETPTEPADKWYFEKADDKALTLIQVSGESGVAAQFSVHVIQLGDMYFIDFYPETPSPKYQSRFNFQCSENNRNGLDQLHWFPGHLFGRLILNDDELKVRFLDPDFLKNQDPARQPVLAYEAENDDMIITASTEALQAFLLRYGADEAVFDSETTLQRQR